MYAEYLCRLKRLWFSGSSTPLIMGILQFLPMKTVFKILETRIYFNKRRFAELYVNCGLG